MFCSLCIDASCLAGELARRVEKPQTLRNQSWRVNCFAIAAIILLAGCSAATTDHPSDRRLTVFAGIPPTAFLVEQIGGPHVKVEVLVQSGQDPHTFEPSMQQTLAFGRAAVFFKIDMPFETVLLEKARKSNPRLLVVDTTRGMKKLTMDGLCCDETHDHSHHDAHDHGHNEHAAEGQPDPHVWLSPPLLKIMAENVAAGLCQADPAHRREYEQNLAALAARIDALHNRVERMLAPHRGQAFYVFHPGFGYFADAYGLKQKAVEAGGRLPTPRQLHALVEQAKADGATVVFVQPQYSPQGVQIVADAIGAKVATLDGLNKNVPADIEEIADKIAAALNQGTPQNATSGDETAEHAEK